MNIVEERRFPWSAPRSAGYFEDDRLEYLILENGPHLLDHLVGKVVSASNMVNKIPATSSLGLKACLIRRCLEKLAQLPWHSIRTGVE